MAKDESPSLSTGCSSPELSLPLSPGLSPAFALHQPSPPGYARLDSPVGCLTPNNSPVSLSFEHVPSSEEFPASALTRKNSAASSDHVPDFELLTSGAPKDGHSSPTWSSSTHASASRVVMKLNQPQTAERFKHDTSSSSEATAEMPAVKKSKPEAESHGQAVAEHLQ